MIDKSKAEVPLIPASRYFDYFLPYLNGNWNNDKEIEIEFTEEQICYINNVRNDEILLTYNNVQSIYSFFCANLFAYTLVRLPRDFSDMSFIDKLGKLEKTGYYN